MSEQPDSELERLRKIEERLLEALKYKRERYDELIDGLRDMPPGDFAKYGKFYSESATQLVIDVDNLAYYLDFDLENSTGLRY